MTILPRRSVSARIAVVLMPLVDVVLLLVLFFALARGVIHTPLVDVALPEARAAALPERGAEETVVAVRPDGSVYLNGRAVYPGALADVLPAKGGAGGVRLRADGAAPFRGVREAIEALREAGIDAISLAVAPAPDAEPEEPAPGAAP